MRISDWSSDVCSSDLTACATLTGWDGLASPASVGYPLFAAWWKQIEEKPGIWKTPFDAATPVTTPRDLKLDDPAVLALLRRALGQAIIDLRHDAIDWTRPWGVSQYIETTRGRVPVPGGATGDGFNRLYGVVAPGKGHIITTLRTS